MQPIECSRCLLTEAIPGVTIPATGHVCSVCRDYDATWGNWHENLEGLQKILNRAKSKRREYDVLVPLSGGKDSTYVLYLCRKVYNVRCLAVTYDNGFLTAHAKQNIETACDRLGVDHFYVRFDQNVVHRLYRKFFLKTGFFCPVCMRGMGIAIGKIQLKFGIPLSISGTSRRTEEHVHSSFFLDGHLDFLENVMNGEALDDADKFFLTPIGVFRSPPRIRMPDFLEWDYNKIYETISQELGWTTPEKDQEHSDCRVEPVVQYIRQRKFPQITPELLRFSKLVTCGQMSKTEARKRAAEAQQKAERPYQLDWFLSYLGITQEEFDRVLVNPERHLSYLKRRNAILRRLKALKNLFIS